MKQLALGVFVLFLIFILTAGCAGKKDYSISVSPRVVRPGQSVTVATRNPLAILPFTFIRPVFTIVGQGEKMTVPASSIYWTGRISFRVPKKLKPGEYLVTMPGSRIFPCPSPNCLRVIS